MAEERHAHVRLPLVSACHGVSGGSQFLGQFHFHLNRCFKRHWVEVFVKLRHQSHTIFPDDPSRFVGAIKLNRVLLLVLLLLFFSSCAVALFDCFQIGQTDAHFAVRIRTY
jgi:hypothetical protein